MSTSRPQPLSERLGWWTLAYRRQRGLTQRHLADLLGCDVRTLRLIEHGDDVRLSMVEAIARVLGVAPLDLLAPSPPPVTRLRGRPRKPREW